MSVQNVMMWIGYVIALLLSSGVFALGLGVAYGQWQEWRRRRLRRAVGESLRELGARMRHQSYWFNVDHAALWEAISEELIDGNFPDAQRVRDQGYRRRLKKLQSGPHEQAEWTLRDKADPK